MEGLPLEIRGAKFVRCQAELDHFHERSTLFETRRFSTSAASVRGVDRSGPSADRPHTVASVTARRLPAQLQAFFSSLTMRPAVGSQKWRLSSSIGSALGLTGPSAQEQPHEQAEDQTGHDPNRNLNEKGDDGPFSHYDKRYADDQEHEHAEKHAHPEPGRVFRLGQTSMLALLEAPLFALEPSALREGLDPCPDGKGHGQQHEARDVPMARDASTAFGTNVSEPMPERVASRPDAPVVECAASRARNVLTLHERRRARLVDEHEPGQPLPEHELVERDPGIEDPVQDQRMR